MKQLDRLSAVDLHILCRAPIPVYTKCKAFPLFPTARRVGKRDRLIDRQVYPTQNWEESLDRVL